MALVGVEQETLVSEPDALTTRPPPCAMLQISMHVFHLTFLSLLQRFHLRCFLNNSITFFNALG